MQLKYVYIHILIYLIQIRQVYNNTIKSTSSLKHVLNIRLPNMTVILHILCIVVHIIASFQLFLHSAPKT